MIVGFTGKKQSGKTTAADHLVANGYRRMSFATTLKSMVALMLSDCGIPVDQIIYYQETKEAVIPAIGVSYRSLCQTLGTEWGREHVHHDLWVNIARHRINVLHDTARSLGVVFDDVRFDNEARMIRDMGGMIIHMRRGEFGRGDLHRSEAGVRVEAGDAVIQNAFNKAYLYERVGEALGAHRWGRHG